MKKDNSISLALDSVSAADYSGLRVAVVGGTGGIGRAVARYIAERGSEVAVVGQTFRDAGHRNLSFIKADLSQMTEALRVAEALRPETLDLLVFTTGIMAGPRREVTAEGIERDLAVSYLNRLVIVRAVADRLGSMREGARFRPRVFLVGFPGTNQRADLSDLNSESSYRRWTAHSTTVAANEALVLEAAKQYAGVDFFGLNPGFVKTGIRQNLFGSRAVLRLLEWLTGFMTSSPEDYASRVAPLLVTRDLDGRTGLMFDKTPSAIQPSPVLLEGNQAHDLVGATDALVARALADSRVSGGGPAPA